MNQNTIRTKTADDISQEVRPNQTCRLFYLDNLKIFLTMLVILHHAGQAYGPTGGFWHYKSSLCEHIPYLGAFFRVNASFFMGLFFLISGYFLPGSYLRNTSKQFINYRLLKYGIPVLFAFFIMVPLEMYFYYSKYSGNKPLPFLNYLIRIYFGIGEKPSWYIETLNYPEFNFGHLWFIQHLLIYSLFYLLYKKLTLNRKGIFLFQSFGYSHLLLTAFIIAVGSSIVRIWYPIDKWVGIFGFIQSEIAHLPQYITLFILGVISYENKLFDRFNKRSGYGILTAGILLASFVYMKTVFSKTIAVAMQEYWSTYESFMAVFLSWGLILVFKEKVNFSSPITRFLCENSYAAYIFHFPIILAVQYGLDKIYIFGATGKFLTVSIVSVIITFFFSYLLRKVSLIREIV